jgi:hypothetical protein
MKSIVLLLFMFGTIICILPFAYSITAANKSLIEVNDIFSLEHLRSFVFKGNITGGYSQIENPMSAKSMNYSMDRWSIEETVTTTIRVLNKSEVAIKLAIKKQYLSNTYESFVFPNDTRRQFTSTLEYNTVGNVTLSLVDYKIKETTNETIHSINSTFLYLAKPDLEIGEIIKVQGTTYSVVNHSLISTYEGDRNATNLLSPINEDPLFKYSYFLNRFIYIGIYRTETMLSYGRIDGLLLAGVTTNTYLGSHPYPYPVVGEVTITDNIDIISSSIIDPGRQMGPIYWLVGGIFIETILIYYFERDTIKKYRGTYKIDVLKKKEDKRIDESINEYEIYISSKEQIR